VNHRPVRRGGSLLTAKTVTTGRAAGNDKFIFVYEYILYLLESDDMAWSYLVVNIVLKSPFDSTDENSKKLALELLQRELKGLSPAYIHEMSKLSIVSVENMKNNGNGVKTCNVNDQRDCGCA